MLLLEPKEASDAIEEYLRIFRRSLMGLTDLRVKDDLDSINCGPESAYTVLNYLYARDFFFKEGSGFYGLAESLQLDVDSIREQLREEEFQSLCDGELDTVNLYSYRPALLGLVNAS